MTKFQLRDINLCTHAPTPNGLCHQSYSYVIQIRQFQFLTHRIVNACELEKNLTTKRFSYRDFHFVASTNLMVHYPNADMTIFETIKSEKYGNDCFVINENAFVDFPMGTRAVYVYDEVLADGSFRQPAFQLKIHPSELVCKQDQNHRVIELSENESLFSYLNLGVDVNFVTVFKERQVQKAEESSDDEMVI